MCVFKLYYMYNKLENLMYEHNILLVTEKFLYNITSRHRLYFLNLVFNSHDSYLALIFVHFIYLKWILLYIEKDQ